MFYYVGLWVNVARLCIEAYDDVLDVHATDDFASAVSNVVAREG
jgi:hypothetical protein